jgi:hypothetical protein
MSEPILTEAEREAFDGIVRQLACRRRWWAQRLRRGARWVAARRWLAVAAIPAGLLWLAAGLAARSVVFAFCGYVSLLAGTHALVTGPGVPLLVARLRRALDRRKGAAASE